MTSETRAIRQLLRPRILQCCHDVSPPDMLRADAIFLLQETVGCPADDTYKEIVITLIADFHSGHV